MNANLKPTLENELVLIRPLIESDLEQLYDVAKDPLIWEQHTSKDRCEKAIFKSFFIESLASNGALVIIDKKNNKVIGSSRFQKIENTNNAIEIGWSFLSRNYWGGTYNKIFKSLMIDHAFNFFDAIIFYIDRRNFRSQKAVEKIGGSNITNSSNNTIKNKSDDHFMFGIYKKDLNKKRIQ